MTDYKQRCAWCNPKNPLYLEYHDQEWGVPRFDDEYLYEMLILESFQAGLSWECVLNKREAFRAAYDGFDINKVVSYDEDKINDLSQNRTIIRNRQKIVASVKNSRIFKKIAEEHGSFYNYLKTFTHGNIFYETAQTKNHLSDTISKDLQKQGMAFVGSVTIYAYLQAIGIIHSHDQGCFLHKNAEGAVLNITNGDYFNSYFLKHFGGEAIPFCEAMMDGKTVSDIFSDPFILLRSAELDVSPEEYRAKTTLPDTLMQNHYTALCLWFGKDTFCQLNLLTLLAYLEQIDYRGKVILNYIDDETFEVLESNIIVTTGEYHKLYENILISKIPQENIGVLSKEAIRLYFDYLNENGMLARLIKDNAFLDKTALLCLLIENSKEYGLSDKQAEKLINIHMPRIKNKAKTMKKVMVIGCPGSGKSTFSKKLHTLSGIPLFHLDQLYWNADKTTVDKSVFLGRLSDILQKEEWIIDGDYRSTMELRLQSCDTLFFLDYPTDVCLDGIRQRCGKERSDLPWTERAGEEDAAFVDFIKNYNTVNRSEVMALLEKYTHKNIFIFKNRSKADTFLSWLENQY